MVELVLISRATQDAFLGLRVGTTQGHLIAPNPEWLAEAAFVDESLSFGIVDGTQPVGLISVIDPRACDPPENDNDSHFHPDCLYVWRVMIDHRHQGRGLARAALEASGMMARAMGLRGITLTTMDREAGNALGLYTALGFRPTGRRLDDEIELMLRF